VPAHYGDRLRALQDGRHLHRAEDPARRDGSRVHLRDGRALLRGLDGAGQPGGDAGGAAVGAAAQAHRALLPPPLGQRARARGAAAVLAGRAARHDLPGLPQGRRDHEAVADAATIQHERAGDAVVSRTLRGLGRNSSHCV